MTSILIIAGFLFSACSSIEEKTDQQSKASYHPDVLASFVVTIPEPIVQDSRLSIEFVNPINAHELNPIYIEMQMLDDRHYQLDYPAKKGMMLQYRYVMTGKNNNVEINSDGKELASRFFFITDHSRIEDTVLGFRSSVAIGETGQIEGTLRLKGSGQSVSDAIITSDGISTTSSFDGRFRLQGIPAGIQNVTIFSPDGKFEPFQQQAVIDPNFVTPIEIELIPKKFINVTFIVKCPENTPASAKLRLFGNLNLLGDSFAGLFGGTSLSQNRAPELSRQSTTEFLIIKQLPVETEIHYLYSLGDSFWNRETSRNGTMKNRTIFTGTEDMVIEDTIESWNTLNYQPITFMFTPPASTSQDERIQIQLNAFGWMDPLEMWPSDNGVFKFVLFSPLNFSAPISYRFCRNEICGTKEIGSQSDQVFSFQAGSSSQTIDVPVGVWATWMPSTEPTIVSTEETSKREIGFNTIVEYSDAYRPSYLIYMENSLNAISGLNANTVILPMSFTFRSAQPVWLDIVPGQNPTLNDLELMIAKAKEKGFHVYLRACTHYPTNPDDFWSMLTQNPNGWDQWFSSIFEFYRSAAEFAESNQVDGIIFGDEDVSPVFFGSTDSSSHIGKLPVDIQQKCNDLFSNIRLSFSREMLLAVNLKDIKTAQIFPLEKSDGLYILNLGQISSDSRDTNTYSANISNILENSIKPIFDEYGKKIWIGLDFPSIDTGYLGCVNFFNDCMVPSVLDFPALLQPELTISLKEQSDLYNAALPEINRREWISGVSTRRYILVGNNQDQSSSIRGKPAADVIWYWYSTMLGIPTQ
ncbi:hypothetical protein [Leptolinea tardivitalis]|uniref:hypothetical protein n=1 Tax=Leptolinea tardivitalis TaxID=229920 RepID=UPI001112A36A|nr:hypothetical protein [Leptolinea tardivitalis]